MGNGITLYTHLRYFLYMNIGYLAYSQSKKMIKNSHIDPLWIDMTKYTLL